MKTTDQTVNTEQALDINLIITQGREISSKEAVSDAIPVNWSGDVMNGKFRDRPVIKSKN